MATCKTCGAYFKQSSFNSTNECNDCVDTFGVDSYEFDPVYTADVLELTNPSGRTRAVFIDDDQEGMQ
jgi:hypothetical protein